MPLVVYVETLGEANRDIEMLKKIRDDPRVFISTLWFEKYNI
jgi:hypothetical protein